MKLKLVAAGGICFLAGVALGVSFSPKFPGGKKGFPVSEPEQARYNSRNAAILRASKDGPASSLPAKNDGIVVPQATGFKDLSEAELATLESLSGMVNPGLNGPLVVVPADLIKQFSQAGQVRSIDQDLFAGGGELAASLQINDTEQERMESEWDAFREGVRSLEKKFARLEEKPDGSLEIVLSGLGDGIAQLRDGFRHSAQAIIGKNRADILYAAAQIDVVVEELGHERKMVVRAEETGDGGWRFHAVVEGPHGKRTYVGENVPQSIRNLTGDLQMAHSSELTE